MVQFISVLLKKSVLPLSYPHKNGQTYPTVVIFKIWNCQSTVTNNLDAIDATDAKNVVKNVDVTDAKNVIKNADITDAKNVIKDIDAADVKNAVKDVDAIDVTDGKYSLMGEMTDVDGKAYEKFLKEGPQEGLTQAEIIGIYKADKQTALNTKSKKVVLRKNIENGTEHVYSVDSIMFPDDEVAGVLRDREYIKNPTAAL